MIRTQRRFRVINAIDCVWNYTRNVQTKDKDFSKQCAKQKCNYICAESIPEFVNKDKKIWEYNYPKEYLNYTNYNILYSKKDRRDIIQDLQILYQEKNGYYLDELNNLFSKFNSILLMQTLEEIINNDISMYTRYGTICYLHEDNGYFYINNSLASLDYKNQLGEQYTNNLYVTNRRSLDDLLYVISDENSQIVRSFCDASIQDQLEILNTLNGQLLIDFVEIYHLTLLKGKIYENEDLIAFFDKFTYKMLDENIVHYLEYRQFDAKTYGVRSTKLTTEGKMRYLGKNGIWMYVNSIADKKRYIKEIENKRENKRVDKFNDLGVSGKRHPGGKKCLFQLVINESSEIKCLKLTKDFLINTTGTLNINFIDIDIGDLDVPNTEVHNNPNLDVVQNANVSRMLNILKVSKIKVCSVITQQVDTKLIEAVKVDEMAQNELTKQEMTDIILEYDILINENTAYPSLEDLKKLGYKGPEVDPHTMRTLMYIYVMWSQKEKRVNKIFKSITNKYLKSVTTIHKNFASKTTGIVCNTMKKYDIIRTILKLKQSGFDSDQKMSREDMLDFIRNIKTGFIEEELADLDNNTLNTIVYVFRTSSNKDSLCKYMYDRIDELGFMHDL